MVAPWPRVHNSQSTATDWRRVLMADPCVYCGDPADGLDHIVPAARGGVDGWSNRAPACTACDQRKRDVSMTMFLLAGVIAERRIRRRTRYGNDWVKRRAAVMNLHAELVKQYGRLPER